MEKRIRGSLIAIAGVGLVAVGAYIGWFAGHLEKGISDDPAVWGQFGDYLGGFLNPLIAAAAFYWLTQSVRIQHTELTATRQALAEAATAQAKAAGAQAEQVRLSALAGQLYVEAALLQATDFELTAMRERINRMDGCWRENRLYVEIDGTSLPPAQMWERMRLVGAQVQDSYRERLETLERIAVIRRQMELAPSPAPADAPDAVPRQS